MHTAYKLNISFMKTKALVLLCLVCSLAMSFGQRHEIGIQAGATSLVGDIGRVDYITNYKSLGGIYGPPIYIGGVYKLNFNPYQGIKVNFAYAESKFLDYMSDEYYRKRRNNLGSNSSLFLEAAFEYNFLPINNEQKEPMLSPYIFAGLGGMFYSSLRYSLDYENISMVDAVGNFVLPTTEPKVSRKMENNLTLSVPFGIGLKYKFNYNWSLFGELVFRPSFTDNLDYSHTKEDQVRVVYDKAAVAAIRGDKKYLTKEELRQIIKPYVEGLQVGNLQSKDWVNSVSLGVSYSFGRPPCYCD